MVWSPDGSQLAYNRNAAGDRVELRLAALDERPARVVMERQAYVAPLAWSPDSTRLLVAIELGSIDEIAWVSLASGETRPVTRLQGTPRNEWHPKAILSPDGQQLAFAKLAGDRRTRDVFVANADGTLEAPVVAHPSDDYPIAWANAGNTLLFASDRTGSTDLWSVPMAGRTPAGLPTRVRRDLGLVRPLGLTREGALYYAVNFSMTDVFTVALDPVSGRIVGRPQALASRFAGNNSGPDLSPDGQEIVYQVGLPGTGIDLVFQSLLRNDERVVRPKLQHFSRPRFDPREQAVVVHGTSPDGTQGVFRVDRATGDVTVLASAQADLANPAWSGDGRTLFFERSDRAVWKLDRQSGRMSEVYAFPDSATNFTSSPSPDGRTLAVVHGFSLYVANVANRTIKEILRVSQPERLHDFPGSLAWMPDGRNIIFGKAVGDTRSLWRISDRGTGLQALGLQVERQNLYFLRVSQDGRRMAFVMGDYDIRPLEVWVMENFLQ